MAEHITQALADIALEGPTDENPLRRTKDSSNTQEDIDKRKANGNEFENDLAQKLRLHDVLREKTHSPKRDIRLSTESRDSISSDRSSVLSRASSRYSRESGYVSGSSRASVNSQYDRTSYQGGTSSADNQYDQSSNPDFDHEKPYDDLKVNIDPCSDPEFPQIRLSTHLQNISENENLDPYDPDDKEQLSRQSSNSSTGSSHSSAGSSGYAPGSDKSHTSGEGSHSSDEGHCEGDIRHCGPGVHHESDLNSNKLKGQDIHIPIQSQCDSVDSKQKGSISQGVVSHRKHEEFSNFSMPQDSATSNISFPKNNVKFKGAKVKSRSNAKTKLEIPHDWLNISSASGGDTDKDSDCK